MGAEQSVAQGIVKSKNFTILGCKENDVYGSFKLIESKGVQYAMISKTCQNHEDYTKLCSTLNQAKSLNEIPQVVKLIEVDTQEETNLCSSFYKVTALYEFYQQTLRDVVKQAPINCLYVLKSLTVGLKELQAHGIVHGNVTPDHILVDTQVGEIKLNNCTQLTGYNHFKKILVSDGPWYLSPELVTALGKKDLRPQYDIEKSEVYALALLALEFWGACDVQKFYDKSTFTLNYNAIDEATDEFGVKNGYVLKNVIRQMLQQDPTSRPTLNELSVSFTQLYDIQTQLQTAQSEPQQVQQQVEYEQTVTVNEIYKEHPEYHEDIVQVNKESFQVHVANEPNEDHVQQPEFEESPKKIEKHHVEPSIKQSVNQSVKDYYVTGSIAAQFGQLLENANEYQSIGTAQFQDDVLQEKSQNYPSQPTSPKGQDSIKPKKAVKAVNGSVNKKPVSIKRPKHETIETKLPKQAVVVSKRR